MKQTEIRISIFLILISLLFGLEIKPVFGLNPSVPVDKSWDMKSKARELGISETKLKKLISSSNIYSGDSINNETDVVELGLSFGGAALSQTGASVSSAGDVNGDGYIDIIIGAYQFNSNTGKVSVYYGGAYMDNVADVVLLGEAAQNFFGSKIASVGDVNGDGYEDVIIGANGYNNYTGRAYLYFGGESMNNIADLVFTGEAINENFGVSVSGAGDVNGDGYPDIIIGANGNNNSTGKAYIFYGGWNINNIADVTMAGEISFSYFGNNVSPAGDFNGDGFGDVLVSATAFNSAVGRVYMYYGGSSMNNTVDLFFNGEALSVFGISTANAGDVNNDGFSDIIIGAYYFNSTRGRTYIFHGGANPNNTADIIFTGESSDGWFGYSVSSAGDVNGDGFSDVIISSPRMSGSKGRVYIFKGGVNMDNIPDKKITGEVEDNYFGESISNAGDIDGDGYPDMIIGAPGYNSFAGKAYLYKNKLAGTEFIDESIMSPVSNQDNRFGVSMSCNDVNGDGYKDIIVGSDYYLNASQQKGAVFVYYGGPLLDTIADVTMYGEQSESRFGESVSSGDLNGDGFADVYVGSSGYSASGVRGKVYIYYGGSNMNNVADLTILGDTTYKNAIGKGVKSFGDVNNDGYDDLILHSISYYNYGIVYLYLGGAVPDNQEDDYYIESSYTFGSEVTSGDLNGDGFKEIIIGDRQYNLYNGIIVIYSRGNSIAMIHGVSGENLGYSMISSDINNDGFDDLITTSFTPDNKDSLKFFYGGSVFDTIPDKLFSFQGSDYIEEIFGTNDVNNDGFKDLLTRAHLQFGYQSNIYFGGVNIDNIPDIIYNRPPSVSTDFPTDAATGDINGDGIADIIISDKEFSGSFYGEGKVYIYRSTPPSIKPHLLSVTDIPNDQGGFIHLKWMRSGYDIQGQNIITSYLIEKSPPPGLNGFAWETEAMISANKNTQYLYTAQTWSDSNSNGSSRIYYRITARTANNNIFWRSNIMFGQSIDNLSPIPPLNLLASSSPKSIDLTWNENTELDLKDYLIYRNDALISSSLTNVFSDNTAEQDSVYIYKVAARDIHNNISGFSNPDTASRQSITMYGVKIIPEGIYNSSIDQLRMRDTVKAYLWDLTGSTVVDSAVGVLDSITFMTDFEFKYAPSGTYYLAIVHRNCVETWSKVGGEAIVRGGTYGYDFTTANTQAYGDNLKLKGTRYCLYSGDVNGSGVVNSTDRTLIRNNVGSTGYVRFDLDGNGVVNSSDRTIVRNNTGISRQRP